MVVAMKDLKEDLALVVEKEFQLKTLYFKKYLLLRYKSIRLF